VDQQGEVKLNVYAFFGRVHPERYDWTIGQPYEVVVAHYDGARSHMRINFTASQVMVVVHSDSNDRLLDMKNRVSRQVRNLADALGYVAAAALDVEILSCVTPEGSHSVFNTAFDGLLENDVEAEASLRIFNVLIRQTERSQYVRVALADLRNAIKEPLDTYVNCYRAIESIRQEYLQGDPDNRSARNQSWQSLREATGTEEEDLTWLKNLAKPRRHGAPIDATHEDRKRALLIARHVVEAHCLIADKTMAPGETTISEAPDSSGDADQPSSYEER
jgi:hypothetical protein